MPKISEMRESKYLKKEDVGAGALATISDISRQNVAPEGQEPELKWILHFADLEKPLVLNMTNAETIASILGSDDTDDWMGKQIVVYNDPNVSFAGKRTGGIRVRAPKVKSTTKVKPVVQPQSTLDDDLDTCDPDDGSF